MCISIDSFRPHANVIQHLHSCSTDDLTVRHFPSGQHPRMLSYWSVRILLHSNDRALRQSVCNVPLSLPELHQSRFAAQLQWYRVPFLYVVASLFVCLSIRSDLIKYIALRYLNCFTSIGFYSALVLRSLHGVTASVLLFIDWILNCRRNSC